MFKKFMTTCAEATMLSSKKEEGILSLFDLLRFYIHLAICKFCRLFERQNKFLIMQMKYVHTESVLSDTEKEQLQKKIEEFNPSK